MKDLFKSICMEYDCHIFSKYLVFQMKNLVLQSKYLVFRLKTLDFDRNTRNFESENFEILGFSHLEFDIFRAKYPVF